MKLSPHFSFQEAIVSQTAARLGIDNTPPASVILNMRQAALGMEAVRRELNNNAIHVSSWYRCPALNKAIGSKPNSAHVKGFAVDFVCPTKGTPEQIVRTIKASGLKYDQLLLEFDSWVHISFDGERRQTLIINKQGAREFA